MKIFISILLFSSFLSSTLYSAEFTKNRTPVQILELNEKTLLNHVWPGMTIKQAVQILGQPEEVLQVDSSRGEAAIRYGVYWLLPQDDGLQIQCIIHQKGLKTYREKARNCHYIDNKYIIAKQ